LNDVVITTGTLVDNQVVKYDSTSQTWINIVLDYSEIANTPDIPADISDLTDTTSLIPTDTNELTNGANFITASAIPAADINNWLGSEDLADAGAVNLSKSAAYFTTSTAETATLAAASTEGKIIVLAAADVSLGSMVVTVTDPSWTGAGTITFAAQGAACTLQYINSKWYCIGNNGATFA
jgi:hypothetical protein